MTSLRFHKYDKYDSPVFIINKTEKDSKQILDRCEKLKEKYPESFLPLYHNSEYDYCTIRFYKDYSHPKFVKRDIYKINYKLYTMEKDGSDRIAAVIKSLKFLGRKKQDFGNELVL